MNYSSFFDDDSIRIPKPFSRSFPMPPFTITLQMGSPVVSSYEDMCTDLNHSLSNYLLEQMYNRTVEDSATHFTSLSLDIHLANRRYLRTFRIIVQNSSVTFEGNGNITVVSRANVFQTDAVLIQTINAEVALILSDSTTLLAYITTHASTASLKNTIGVSTLVNGHVYTSPAASPLVDNTKKHGMSVKRLICQIFGYTLIAIAGVSALGWIYLFYLRYISWKEDLTKKRTSRLQKKGTRDTTDSSPSHEDPISNRSCSKNTLQVSRNTTHEELSDDSLRDDSLFDDQDDDSFAIKLQKAIVMDRSSNYVPAVKADKSLLNTSERSDPMLKPFIPTLKPPRRGTHRMMYSLPKSGKDHDEIDIPDHVDFGQTSDSSSSSSEYGETPISYFQISTQSTSQHIELIHDNSTDAETSGGYAVDFTFKNRPFTSVERVIPKDEYDAAIDAASIQIKQVLSSNREFYKRANDIENHSSDEKRNVRDYLVAKLSSLIQKIDPGDMIENKDKDMNILPIDMRKSSMNEDCMSDNDTGTVSTSGPCHGDDANVRLGIHPINSKDNSYRPPSSISVKRFLQDVSNQDTMEATATAIQPHQDTMKATATAIQPLASYSSDKAQNKKSNIVVPSRATTSIGPLKDSSSKTLHTQNVQMMKRATPSSTLHNADKADQSRENVVDITSNTLPSVVPKAGLNAFHSHIFTKGLSKTDANSMVDNTIPQNVWKQTKVLRSNPPQSTPYKIDNIPKVHPTEHTIDSSFNLALHQTGSRPVHTHITTREPLPHVFKTKNLDAADSRQIVGETKKSSIDVDPRSTSTSPIGKVRKQPASEVSLYAIHEIISPSSINQQSGGVKPSAVKAAAESLKRSQSRFKDPTSWMFAMNPSEELDSNVTAPPPPRTPPRVPCSSTIMRPKSPVYAVTPPQVPQVNSPVQASQEVLRGGASKIIEKFERKSNLQYVL